MERDIGTTRFSTKTRNFNSHAHVERDTAVSAAGGTEDDFNSHAHVERDLQNFPEWTNIYISTHTLTWSVTHRFVTAYL